MLMRIILQRWICAYICINFSKFYVIIVIILYFEVARNYNRENEDPQNVSVISVEDNSKSMSNDNDEILIELVFQRPTIWNYKLLVRDRTKPKINALWVEVANAMGEGNVLNINIVNKINVESMFWNIIRELYLQYR